MKRRFQGILAGLCVGVAVTVFGGQAVQAQPGIERGSPSAIRAEVNRLANEDAATYEFKSGGVKFTVPEGWRDEKQPNGAVLALFQ